MTTIIAASALYVVVVVVSLLLIAGSIENAAKIQQAMAQNSDSLPSTKNNNEGILNVGPPEKMTIAGQSKPPVLSPEKKQVLEHDQAKTHDSPELPISDQTIQGPTPGTQAQ